MHVTIEINGRQALPVRTIPLLTDWRGLSPDQLAQILAGDSDHWPSFDGLTAYSLRPDGSTEPIPPRWWVRSSFGQAPSREAAASKRPSARPTHHVAGTPQNRPRTVGEFEAITFG